MVQTGFDGDSFAEMKHLSPPFSEPQTRTETPPAIFFFWGEDPSKTPWPSQNRIHHIAYFCGGIFSPPNPPGHRRGEGLPRGSGQAGGHLLLRRLWHRAPRPQRLTGHRIDLFFSFFFVSLCFCAFSSQLLKGGGGLPNQTSPVTFWLLGTVLCCWGTLKMVGDESCSNQFVSFRTFATEMDASLLSWYP